MPTIDTARLRELYHYDLETGIFINKTGPRCGRPVHRKTPSIGSYVRIRIAVSPGKYERFRAHRLAWQYVYGDIPSGIEVDHINRDPSDNRICNLRLATHAQNTMNQTVHSNNRIGMKGVSMQKGRYRAQIDIAGKTISLGTFDTPEQAHKAYCAAAKRSFGAYASDGAPICRRSLIDPVPA